MEKLTNYLNELKRLDEIDKEQDETKKEIKKVLQNNNIKIAFYNDVINDILTIWNKYEGKQLGEATRNKIKTEIETAFNNQIFAYLPYDIQYEQQKITVTTRDETGKFTGKTKIYITTNLYYNEMLKNNQIQKISKEQTREQEAKTYISDLNETAEKIKQLHATAKQYEEELNKIHNEINKLSNYKLKCVNYCNCVNNWII